MSRETRREHFAAKKHEILDRYLERGQLATVGDHDDMVFYIPNQLVVAEHLVPEIEPKLDRYGATRGWGTARLTRPDAADAATAAADRAGRGAPPPIYDLDPAHEVDTAELALDLADRHGGGVALNHLVTGLQRHTGWPDGDPEPARKALGPMPTPVPGAGAGVMVAVIDTGWPSAMPPDMNWFDHGCDHSTHAGEVDDHGRPMQHLDRLDADHDGYLDVEAGHGLFIAGVIRRLAPSAQLLFLKALNSDGMGTELGVARAIGWAVARGADVVNLSLGFYTLRNTTPEGVASAVGAARAHGAVVVGAAGNDAIDDPTYPAALPGVIGVGALDADRERPADFSNHGDWLNVYAPGEEVQSTYVRGRENPDETVDGDPDRFATNTALWSGTSFACAHVSGYLASALSEPAPAGRPTSAPDRAEALIDDLPEAFGARRLVASGAF
jgi:hypothetical protein